jgi:hypothetical protein
MEIFGLHFPQPLVDCPGLLQSAPANIAKARGSMAKTIGAYRFFQNKKVTMDVLLTAYTEATIERIKKQRVVLPPRDTTTLNYTHPYTKGHKPCHVGHQKTMENYWLGALSLYVRGGLT